MIRARPEDIPVDWRRAALLVVDAQNAFLSEGGMLDLAGLRGGEAGDAITRIARLLEAFRRGDLLRLFLRIAHPPGWDREEDTGSPFDRKALVRRLGRERPELRGRLLTEGTWDAEVVRPLAPRADETVITKRRYSGFVGTDLDRVLTERGVQWLLLAGVASNVCVESTLRDAFQREYWPILVEDATIAAGPAGLHEAMVKNTELFFGWVTTTSWALDAIPDRAVSAHAG